MRHICYYTGVLPAQQPALITWELLLVNSWTRQGEYRHQQERFCWPWSSQNPAPSFIMDSLSAWRLLGLLSTASRRTPTAQNKALPSMNPGEKLWSVLSLSVSSASLVWRQMKGGASLIC
ncbi:hypothetical protein EYF80_012084 [Liparis tanakae]|uniref:Uncharacterized protein n=1 Tax=Liparis tanakae TaxID=230148 RepID=A0A4Z2IIL6_9TELE|nr:hypothetical protein EYF80_012084 [Liparis tanakae]